MTIRVLVVDDDTLVRAGLRMMIETQDDLVVAGEAANGDEAVALARELAPDVVLMDIRMPGMDGIEATRRITSGPADPDGRARGGDTGPDGPSDNRLERGLDDLPDDGQGPPRVVILTTFEIDQYVYEAVRAGASGFLLKRTPPEDLLAGIRTIAHGDALLSPSITRRLMREFARATTTEGQPTDVTNRELSRLTEREREVLIHIGHGLANREIAQQLSLGESTVKTHVKRILMKLALRDRVHAVVYAYESGLLSPRARND